MRLYLHCSLLLLFCSFIYDANAKKDKRYELVETKYDGKFVENQNYESEEKSIKHYNKKTPKIDVEDGKECKEHEKRGNKENNDSNFEFKRKYTKKNYERREIETHNEKQIDNCIKTCKKLGKIEDKSDFPNNKSKNRPYENSKLYKENNKKNSNNGFEEYGSKYDKKKREINHEENNDSSEEIKTQKGKTKIKEQSKNKKPEVSSSDNQEQFRKREKNTKLNSKTESNENHDQLSANKTSQIDKLNEEAEYIRNISKENHKINQEQNITKKKMNNKSSEEDDSNEDSDESIEYSKKKKIKYSIKFAHEKAKHGKEVDKTLMRIHRNGKNGHESEEDEDDDEEDVHPKRLQIVDEDDDGF